MPNSNDLNTNLTTSEPLITDNVTAARGYPKPDADNPLIVDCDRIGKALDMVDKDIDGLDTDVTQRLSAVDAAIADAKADFEKTAKDLQDTADANAAALSKAVGEANSNLNAAIEKAQDDMAASLSQVDIKIAENAATLRNEFSAIVAAGTGYMLKITFAEEFTGATYTVTSADGAETKTRTVPESLTDTVTVTKANTIYTVAATYNGKEYTSVVATTDYFGEYRVLVSTFTATLAVTVSASAVVTAVCGNNAYSATATSGNRAVLTVRKAGTYTVSAVKDNASSDTATVQIETDGGEYTAEVHFITLVITADEGNVIEVTDGVTSLTGISSGTDTFYLPNTGTWTATAGSETDSVEVSAYQAYTLDLTEGETTPFEASLTTKASSEYTRGISTLSPEKLSQIAMAISKNSAITNRTTTVYVDSDDEHYLIKVGDNISVTISNASYNVILMGFNHYDLYSTDLYGKGTATNKAGMLFQTGHCLATKYQMNATNVNDGGWSGCDLRATMQNTIKNSLTAAWKAALKIVLRKVSKGNQSTELETVPDNFFLPTEVEVLNTNAQSVAGEGMQYAWYVAGNAKIKNVGSSADSWWLASPCASNAATFCFVYANGAISYYTASDSYGVAPCFCV